MNIENKSPTIVIQVITPFIAGSKLCKDMDISRSTLTRLIEKGFVQVIKMEGEKGSVFINMADLSFKAAQQSITIQEYLKTVNKKG